MGHAAKWCKEMDWFNSWKGVEGTTLKRIIFLNLVLLNQDRHCLWKQRRSRSDGFWRSHLIRIYTVFHKVCEFIWTNNTELSDWLTIRNGCGKLNLFSRIRVKKVATMCVRNTLFQICSNASDKAQLHLGGIHLDISLAALALAQMAITHIKLYMYFILGI